MVGVYRTVQAEQRARQRESQPRKARRLVPGEALWKEVVDLLKSGSSPEQVSAILRRMHSEEPQFRVSHETIYTAIYAMPCGELRKEVIALLRQSQKNVGRAPAGKIVVAAFRTWSVSMSVLLKLENDWSQVIGGVLIKGRSTPQRSGHWWNETVCSSPWSRSVTPAPRPQRKGSVSFSTGLMPKGG